MTTIDNKIEELIQKVKKQQEAIKKDETSISRSWKTNCSFSLSISPPVNIQVINEGQVVAVVSKLIEYEEYMTKAKDVLGLSNNSPIRCDGFPVSDWIDDCKKRLAMINIREKKQKLEELETRLNAIVSPEQRRQMELAAIADLLDE